MLPSAIRIKLFEKQTFAIQLKSFHQVVRFACTIAGYIGLDSSNLYKIFINALFRFYDSLLILDAPPTIDKKKAALQMK